MNGDDRLLDALQAGDEHCPDGRALARLGDVVRAGAAPPRRPDLAARVLAACRDPAALAAVDEDDDALVDALYDGDEADVRDSRLIRLKELIREASRLEREPDLLPQLAETLAGTTASGRRRTERQLDGDLRWRIWSVVVGGHVAALLTLALLNIDFGGGDAAGGNRVAANAPDHGPGGYQQDPFRLVERIKAAEADAAITELPASWADLRSRPRELFRLRSNPELRAYARKIYGCQDTTRTVERGLRWLELQQHEDGYIGKASGRRFVDLAAHGMATLALLGEGVDEVHRARAIRAALDWIVARQDAFGSFGDGAEYEMVYGVLALALTEGAILLEDEGYRAAAERTFANHAHVLVRQGGAGGLNGFALLAIETASLSGFALPTGLARAGEGFLRRPDTGSDAGTVGLSLFGNAIRGRFDRAAAAAGTRAILGAADPAGTTCDPLGWYFASLALRDVDRLAWRQWNTMVTDQILFALRYDDAGCWMPAGRIRYAQEAGPAGDVLATSISLLNLQACYRYLPVDVGRS